MIKQEGEKWVLMFSDGRREEFDNEAAAKRREQQVEHFKHVAESKDYSDCDVTLAVDLSESRIDPDGKAIRGVSILGRFSRDSSGAVRKEYSDTALWSAIEAMEGAPAFIDHGDPKKERSFHDAYGFYRGGTVLNEGTDRARAVKDLHLLDCEDARKVVSMAKSNPSMAGNSIHAGGRCKIQGTKQMVEQVMPRTMWGHKSSTDLVIDPATTSALIESKQKGNQKTEENRMELKDINLEEMRTARPDIASAFLKEGQASREAEITTLREEKQQLQAKIDAYQVRESLQLKAGKIDTILSESKLPAEAITPLFKQTLMNLNEQKDGEKVVTVEQQAKALVEERRAFLGGVKGNSGKGGAGNGSEVSDKQVAGAFKSRRKG